MYEVDGIGGLYPEGCTLRTQTANAAIERYRALRIACGQVAVRDRNGAPLSVERLVGLAKEELTSEV